MSNEPYEIKENGAEPFLVVCGWCYPGESILDTFPQLRHEGVTGKHISHGICPAHKAKMLRDAKLLNAKQEAPVN